MVLKKFIHKEKETCNITQKEILTTSEKEQWCAIIEYEGGKQKAIGYYKSEYLKGLIKGEKKKIVEHLQGKINDTTKNIFAQIKPMMDSLTQ